MEKPIFEFTDYKLYIQEFIRSMPGKGRGQVAKIAAHLSVNAVTISQVLRGNRDLSTEQAVLIGEYFGLEENEKEYLTFLVAKVRAGHFKLESLYERKLSVLRAEWSKAKSRVVEHRVLSDEEKAVYYSSWQFAAIGILSSIKGYNSIEGVSKYLDIPKEKVQSVVGFLLEHGLCKGTLDHFEMGDAATYVDSSSPYVINHRRNWRIKAMEALENPPVDSVFYSSPVSISQTDQKEIKEELLKLIGRFSKRIDKTNPELLCCLNLDWFSLKKK